MSRNALSAPDGCRRTPAAGPRRAAASAAEGATITKARPWLTALVSFVILLILIAALGNQWVTDSVARHANAGTFGDHLAHSVNVYAVAVQPAIGRRHRPFLGGEPGQHRHRPDADAAARRGGLPRQGRLLAIAVRRLVHGRGGHPARRLRARRASSTRAQLGNAGQGKAEQILFSSLSPGPATAFAGLASGLVVGLAAGITAVLSRRTEVRRRAGHAEFRGALDARCRAGASLAAGRAASRPDRHPVAVVGQRHRPDAGSRRPDRTAARHRRTHRGAAERGATDPGGAGGERRHRQRPTPSAMTPRRPRSSVATRRPRRRPGSRPGSPRARTTRAPRSDIPDFCNRASSASPIAVAVVTCPAVAGRSSRRERQRRLAEHPGGLVVAGVATGNARHDALPAALADEASPGTSCRARRCWRRPVALRHPLEQRIASRRQLRERDQPADAGSHPGGRPKMRARTRSASSGNPGRTGPARALTGRRSAGRASASAGPSRRSRRRGAGGPAPACTERPVNDGFSALAIVVRAAARRREARERGDRRMRGAAGRPARHLEVAAHGDRDVFGQLQHGVVRADVVGDRVEAAGVDEPRAAALAPRRDSAGTCVSTNSGSPVRSR